MAPAMKTFTVRHEIACTPERFWELIHFGGFNRVMYDEYLGYEYEVLEDDAETGVRKTHITPNVDAPKVLVKALGEKVSFEEHGQYTPDPPTYSFHVLPGVFPKKIDISGKMTTEPNGSDKCWRIVEFKVGCTIFGIGKLFEGFVSKEIQKTYEQSAVYTNDFVKKHS